MATVTYGNNIPQYEMSLWDLIVELKHLFFGMSESAKKEQKDCEVRLKELQAKQEQKRHNSFAWNLC
jgi:hypothetical protein